jgi:hypothetical protein
MDTDVYQFLHWIPKTLSKDHRYEVNQLFLTSHLISEERFWIIMSDTYLSCYGLSKTQMNQFRALVKKYRTKQSVK